MDASIALGEVNAPALDAAVRASFPANYYGFSTGAGPDAIFHFNDDTTPTELTQVEDIINAHDPVFISVSRSVLPSDNATPCLVSVQVVRVDAAPVTLLINGTPVSVPLTNRQGSITIIAAASVPIVISLQNPYNRCVDVLNVQVS